MKTLTQMIEIARKELLHILRDRRTVVSTQLYALLGPILLVVTIGALAGDPQRTLRVGMVGQDAAITQALTQRGLEIVPQETVPLTAQALEKVDVVVAIPPDAAKARERHRSVQLDLFTGKDADQGRAEEEVRRAIGSLSARISSTALIRQGVAPVVTQPYRVNTVALDDTSKLGLFASVFILYIVLAPFLASSGAAIDSATGERERGTLALMRLQPLSPVAWVAGKWAVISLFGWAGALVTTVVSALTLHQLVPAQAVELNLGVGSVMLLALAALPVSLLASAVGFALALQARTTMEAQTRLTMVSILPVAVGLMATAGAAPQGVSLPVLFELTSLPAWLTGAAFPVSQALVSGVLSIALIVGVVLWGARRITSEDYWVA
ncbi:MAG: ABC transporter permease subunit [Pseudomonadota bacterium]